MEIRCVEKLKPSSEKVQNLAKTLFTNPKSWHLVISELLLQRGVENFIQAKNFFRPSLTHLHDSFLMKDMKKAVERICFAIENKQRILIYGDYDVDGTMAVSLLYNFLTSFYKEVTTYIPDRYKEGYGVSLQGIDFASDNNIALILTLDCGIKAFEALTYAKKKGIDVIVCDHHQPDTISVEAYAILNPKQTDCPYPYKELCGCGVTFKLVQALIKQFEFPSEMAFHFLNLVGVATAADIVPITGENRTILYFALEEINKNKNDLVWNFIPKGVQKISVRDLVFSVAPRINAAGRMKHASLIIDFFTQKENNTELLQEIEFLNTQRKEYDQQVTLEALQQIQENGEENQFSTVVFSEKWHKGIIGIVASRLTETYYRPTLVFTKSGEKLAASARSVKNFDIYKALEKCSDLLEQFGGHTAAAGLTLLPEKYIDFKNKFEKVVCEAIDENDLFPKIEIDAEISLEMISEKFYQIIKQMAPFGPSNSTPIFITKGVFDNGSKAVGEGNHHLQLRVCDAQKEVFANGIAFSMGDKLSQIQKGNPFDIVYSLEENNWNGITSIQLKIRAILIT